MRVPYVLKNVSQLRFTKLVGEIIINYNIGEMASYAESTISLIIKEVCQVIIHIFFGKSVINYFPKNTEEFRQCIINMETEWAIDNAFFFFLFLRIVTLFLFFRLVFYNNNTELLQAQQNFMLFYYMQTFVN